MRSVLLEGGRAAEAANLAYLNGQTQREAEARHHVQVLTRHIDALLTLRATAA